jgi:hypothetical protein
VYSKEEKKDLVQRFWTEFDLFCASKPYLARRKKTWMLHHTKVPNVHLRFDPGRKSVQVAIELLHRSEEKRLEMFETIEQYKSIIEKGFEHGLCWDFVYIRENGQEVCRIYTEKPGLDLHRENNWPDIFEFMASNMYRLERNFMKIRDLITE